MTQERAQAAYNFLMEVPKLSDTDQNYQRAQDKAAALKAQWGF